MFHWYLKFLFRLQRTHCYSEPSLSLSHSLLCHHPLTASQLISNTHTCTPSLPLTHTFTHTHTHTLLHSHTHSLFLACTRACAHTHTHTPSLTVPYTLTYTQTFTQRKNVNLPVNTHGRSEIKDGEISRDSSVVHKSHYVSDAVLAKVVEKRGGFFFSTGTPLFPTTGKILPILQSSPVKPASQVQVKESALSVHDPWMHGSVEQSSVSARIQVK